MAECEIAIAAAREFQRKPAPERLRLALTASQARELAAAEGLPLIPLPGSKSGYKGVYPAPPNDTSLKGTNGALFYSAKLGTAKHDLGTYATAEEAALVYARCLGREVALAEVKAMEVVSAERSPLTKEEVLRLAAEEELELIKPSRPSITGYKGVVKQRNGLFGAQYAHQTERKTTWLGMFATPEEAALQYARYIAGKLHPSTASTPAERQAETSTRRARAGMRGARLLAERRREHSSVEGTASAPLLALREQREDNEPRKRAAATQAQETISRWARQEDERMDEEDAAQGEDLQSARTPRATRGPMLGPPQRPPPSSFVEGLGVGSWERSAAAWVQAEVLPPEAVQVRSEKDNELDANLITTVVSMFPEDGNEEEPWGQDGGPGGAESAAFVDASMAVLGVD
jgi:hypothetical protein